MGVHASWQRLSPYDNIIPLSLHELSFNESYASELFIQFPHIPPKTMEHYTEYQQTAA